MRENQTEPEKIVWQYLRNRQFQGLRFVRQFSVGPYIIDFYCPEIRLAIEIDGKNHSQTETRAYDLERTKYLGNFNIKVIRLKNEEVAKEIQILYKILEERLPLS